MREVVKKDITYRVSGDILQKDSYVISRLILNDIRNLADSLPRDVERTITAQLEAKFFPDTDYIELQIPMYVVQDTEEDVW
jgi:hypothetical protein